MIFEDLCKINEAELLLDCLVIDSRNLGDDIFIKSLKSHIVYDRFVDIYEYVERLVPMVEPKYQPGLEKMLNGLMQTCMDDAMLMFGFNMDETEENQKSINSQIYDIRDILGLEINTEDSDVEAAIELYDEMKLRAFALGERIATSSLTKEEFDRRGNELSQLANETLRTARKRRLTEIIEDFDTLVKLQIGKGMTYGGVEVNVKNPDKMIRELDTKLMNYIGAQNRRWI